MAEVFLLALGLVFLRAEDLLHVDMLIGEGDDAGFFAARELGEIDGPHMAFDDSLDGLVDAEVAHGVLRGDIGVGA